MSNSKYIAGLMGPLLAIMGLSMLLNPSLFPAMASQLESNYGLVFVAGIMALVAGLAVVRAHNIWEPGWRVIITIFGWLAVVGGIARMMIPDQAAAIAASFVGSGLITVAAVIQLALGAFLTFKGYWGES
ncbi:MAG TPA: hypothetical protein VJ045_02375 [Hyphomicrobiaceae bacterium]|nr:hypothetical protein [Hyphomicrobiaceae bacterium]